MVTFIKRGLKAFVRTGAASRIITRLEAAADRRPNLLRVLTYHRVDWPDASADLYPGTLSATPDEFQWQIEHLADRYRLVNIRSVLAALRGEHELPPKSVLITFDDAYSDFAEDAWPVLRKCSVPAVLFVPTAFPGNDGLAFWWDRLHQAARDTGKLETAIERRRFRELVRQIKAMPHADAMAAVDDYCQEHPTKADASRVLTWDQLRKLREQGLDLAAHTRTHPLMTRISVEQAVEEARQSRMDLREQTGTDLPVFAYPGGACSTELVQPLRDAGFEVAFTTRRGINDLRTAAPLLLRRINISHTTPRTALRAQLLAGMRHLSPLWRR